MPTPKSTPSDIAEALNRLLQSPNVADSNGEIANVVDTLNAIAQAGFSLSRAITPCNAVAGRDETGGHVESLTEAVMGITAGLAAIAHAIETLANAVENRP